MIYSGGQSFWIDPNQVQGAPVVYVTAIELFFRSKPPLSGNENSSGLQGPGVSLQILQAPNDVPTIDQNHSYEIARVEWNDIGISSDASDGTTFRFTNPVPINTGQRYSFVFSFDGGATFILHRNKSGEVLIGTTDVTPGAQGTNSGRYFDGVAAASAIDSGEVVIDDPETWRPMNDVDLKYHLFIARFSINGVPVAQNANLVAAGLVHSFTQATGNTVEYSNGEYLIPPERMEILTFDQKITTKENFIGGQMAYQNTFSWPGGFHSGSYGNTAQKVAVVSGSVYVTASNNFPNGQAFLWANVFNNYAGDKYLVVKSGADLAVRKVFTEVSNTVIALDEPIPFSNNQAEFLLTPCGRIDQFNKSSPFGLSESFLILTHSSANSTLRFVNSTIEAVTVVGGGTGYHNNDILYLNGWEYVAGKIVGGYRAQGNLVTNSSGGVTAVYLSNSGAGFYNSGAITIAVGNSDSYANLAAVNSTANSSNGSGLTLSFDVGASVRTEFRANNNFRGINVVNIPISDILPFWELTSPGGTAYQLSLDTRYERFVDNTSSTGFVYHVDEDPTDGEFDLTMFLRNPLEYSKVPVMPSRSNEFIITLPNGSNNSYVNSAHSTQVLLHMDIQSNNDFTSIFVNNQPTALFSKYLINNDYTGEETDRGNAWAKGTTRRFNLKAAAEDLIIYLTAYKPSGTDIQVYARLHNSQDPEAIDDKQWTRMELWDGQDILSSTQNKQDYIGLTYGIPQVPNTEFILDGIFFATNASAALAGQSANANGQIVAGDLVVVYPTLFPQIKMVQVVNSVTNTSELVLGNPITNNSFLGQSLTVEKVQFPFQAYRNYMNDNVARYHGSTMSDFDGYDSVQVKIVMLSDSPNRIPRIDDIAGDCVSP